MSLHDIFMQRAALEHQNELVSDNTGIILQSLAQGVAKGIEDEQVRVQQRRDEDRKFKQAVDLVNIKSRADASIDSFKEKRENRIANQAELSNATKLRTEFINRPEVKDFITVNTNVNAMQKLLDTALASNDKQNYVAVDQGIITMYNKLTDPASVVRESEYARTPENLPMINRMLGAIGKVQAGGAGLTNDDRKALVEGAKIILKERANPYNSALQEYADLSSQYGINPSMVTRGMQPYSPEAIKSVGVNIESVSVPPEKEAVVNSYMKKYPTRTREQVIRAMQKQGVL